MFIGHLGVALALKRAEKRVSLGLLFIAVQFVDIILGFNILLGVEKVNVASGSTYHAGIEFAYFPFTHSLVASLVWAGVVYALFKLVSTGLSSQRSRVALVMGSGVLSHFFLDAIVHRPDLPLFGNGSYKIGLGLWNYQIAYCIVEGLILFGGLWIYIKSTAGITTPSRRYGMVIFAAILLIINTGSTFGPPPQSAELMAAQMIVLCPLLAGIAFWLDLKRN